MLNPELRAFTYELVLAATSDFSEANKVGQGGFGTVYKGNLATGQEVAVKKLSKCSEQGKEDFKNELILIYQLQHINLKVIYRDLKASNILLDDHMNPKISDFGMARIFTQELGANTKRIVGTQDLLTIFSFHIRYSGNFSVKSDVYSYGVLLLEIISGRKYNSSSNEDRVLNLVGHAWELWKAGRGEELRDPTLVETSIRVDRPDMSKVVSMLTNESMQLPKPKKPAFYYA
ncbi:G-type lectin S-receptor-like serine/threonine-protein kinase [Pyrus ussuriensis x Pyrus communis]|uniref:G-type lectin S-receptor-like serine/threonine-protein kinase n=1 Tax=Pyrus ussuriensis x Pyrus communis TaxID=2448454 RepID=A0A5N5FFK4_9ROSA|nr:G-type lectin S-receptor-like serine/threonine-protein kinase [Pyrus ussuriensis x Pyrus communis]